MKPFEQMRRHPVKIALVTLSLVALAWWIHHHQDELSKEAVIGFGKNLPALWFLVLFLVLPLAGFPISVFLVLAGIRFGFWGGLAVSGAAVFFHNFAAYRLTHGLFRTRLRAFLERAGYAIPPIGMVGEGESWYSPRAWPGWSIRCCGWRSSACSSATRRMRPQPRSPRFSPGWARGAGGGAGASPRPPARCACMPGWSSASPLPR
jgi:hypothetical protein